MNALRKQYENARKKALNQMKMGNIPAYLLSLNEMNRYKKLLQSVYYN